MAEERVSGRDDLYTIYGMFCSYFTKKLETYFLVKGIPYQFVELDAPGFSHIPRNVGVMQIPVVECPDGSWLCDTTAIIQHFEKEMPAPALTPRGELAGFLSRFLEDCFDEWLWAPALYYRWAFEMDERRRSDEFTYTIASNGLPLPRFLLRKVIKTRQIKVHLEQNGLVSPAHCRQIEDLYIDLIDKLQPILKKRPFLFGDRPCEADFGLHGPMFPHFANDPTSQEIMQVRGPHVFRWVARLWSKRPEEIEGTDEIGEVPGDLKDLVQMLATQYVPYLVANRNAYYAGNDRTQYVVNGLEWDVVTAPYRVFCLAQLQEDFQRLNEGDKQRAREFLGVDAACILESEIRCPDEMKQVAALNPGTVGSDEPVSRLWRPKSLGEKFLESFRARRPSGARPELKVEGGDWLPIYFRHHRARP